MKALFCFDHHFTICDGFVHSADQFPYSLWGRYLRHFEHLVVCGRIGDAVTADKRKRWNISSGPGVSFHLLPNFATPRSLFAKRRQALKTLERLIENADVVIARVPSQIGLLAVSICRRQGKPYVVELVACPWDQYVNHGTLLARLYAPIMTARVKHLVFDAPVVQYVTSSFLQARYPNQRGLCFAISDVELTVPEPAITEQRMGRYRALSGKGPVFGLIGSLRTKYKGLHVALEALGRLKGEGKLREFRFRVLGGGDPSPWQKIAERWDIQAETSFDGSLPSGDPVRAWLREIDIYLQPSFQEGLPRALIEAMNAGCPAIASTAGGIPELLRTDCVHRPGSASELKELIAHACSDTQWLIDQSAANLQRANEFLPSKLEKKHDEMWKAVLQKIER